MQWTVSAARRSAWWDYFLPVTLYEWLWTGRYAHQHCLGLFLLYTIAWAGPMTLGFFCWELYLIYSGMTPYEINKSESRLVSCAQISVVIQTAISACTTQPRIM